MLFGTKDKNGNSGFLKMRILWRDQLRMGIMNRGGSHHNVPDQQNDVFSKENMRHSMSTG